MSDFFIHFSARKPLSKLILAALIGLSAPAYFLGATEVHAQTVDAMQAGPGEKSGTLGKGELLVYALKREKIDPASISQAMKSMGELFDFKHTRTGDRYLYKLGNGRKLTLLRYQRAQHIYETRLNEAGNYVSRLLDPGETPAPAEAFIHPPQTELSDEEVDVERTAVMGAEAPVPTAQAAAPAASAADDVRQDDDFAPPDAPPQPIDEALMGRPNPDDLPAPSPSPSAEITDGDDGFLEDEIDAELPQIAEQPRDTQATDDTASAAQTTANQHNAPVSEPLKIDAIGNIPEPRFVPLPSSNDKVARPEPPRPYAPFSLALACLGLIALIAGILITIIPSWRARQHLKSAGLTIEDEIYISKGQHLALVSDAKHRYLLAVSADATRLLTCCDDSAEAQRAWSFFKKKTYWQQLGAKALNDRQLTELIKAFNDSDTPEPESEQPKQPVPLSDEPAKQPEPMPIVSNTPTLPGGLLGKNPRDPSASDDHETLEVPELTDLWFSK